MDIEID